MRWLIFVLNTINIYEIDGKDVAIKDRVYLEIESHWNRPQLVTLKIDGKSLTVGADALKLAIANATNTRD